MKPEKNVMVPTTVSTPTVKGRVRNSVTSSIGSPPRAASAFS